MSIKYFTGSNASSYAVKASGDVHTFPSSRLGATAMTYFWYPETAPVDNADGIDVKPQALSKFVKVAAKVHSTSCLGMKGGKARGVACKGKYDLGKMYKYRKTLKKIASAAGFAVGGAVGERNMFTNKGNGNTGDTTRPKNAQCLPLVDSYELFPIDAGK